MPKREPEEADATPKKRAATDRKAWSAEEEAQFAAHINTLCTEGLWRLCKDDPILAARSGSSVRSHWNAIFKKAFEEPKQ